MEEYVDNGYSDQNYVEGDATSTSETYTIEKIRFVISKNNSDEDIVDLLFSDGGYLEEFDGSAVVFSQSQEKISIVSRSGIVDIVKKQSVKAKVV
jgi:hypothetical protein